MGNILDKYFKDINLNWDVKCCILACSLSTSNIWAYRIKDLISKDIPAIIFVGPSLWKDTVPLYKRSKDNIYKKATYEKYTSVDNHYFNVTAIIEDNVRKEINHFDSVMYEVSSWGAKYYISEKEIEDFISRNSSLFTNVVYIEDK